MAELACGSKESLNAPFSVSPSGGKPGRAGSPHDACTLPASKKRWHASMPRLPPQEGISKRSAEIPLAYPPNRLRRKESFMACGSKEVGFFNADWRRRTRLESVEQNDKSDGLRPSRKIVYTENLTLPDPGAPGPPDHARILKRRRGDLHALPEHSRLSISGPENNTLSIGVLLSRRQRIYRPSLRSLLNFRVSA
jgi:hypothetical protein